MKRCLCTHGIPYTLFIAVARTSSPPPILHCLVFRLGRWTITFLDLASNVPQVSANSTGSETEESRLAPTAGAVGVVAAGVETVREASTTCCIGGNFSLSFNGLVTVDVDLADVERASSDYLVEILEDVIDEGKSWRNFLP